MAERDEEGRVISRMAVVEYKVNSGRWETAVQRVDIGRGLIRNDRLEFIGDDRLAAAKTAGEQYSKDHPQVPVRVLDVKVTEHYVISPDIHP